MRYIILSILFFGSSILYAQRLKIDFEAEQRKPAKNLPSQSVLNLSLQQFKAYDDSARARIERSKFPRKIGEAYLVDVIDGHPIYWSTFNAGAAKSVGTNVLHDRYSNLISPSPSIGALRMGIWDGGAVKSTHVEFGDRVTNITTREIDYHATHVAGTMIASGVKDEAKGMLPNGRLSAFSFLESDANYWLDLRSFSNTFPNGLVSNHSYGSRTGWNKILNNPVLSDGWYFYGLRSINPISDYRFGYYSNISRDLDFISFLYKNHLMVFAAGNDRSDNPALNPEMKRFYLDENSGEFIEDLSFYIPADGFPLGFDCLPTEMVSKNVLVVGAIFKSNGIINSKADISSALFSSFGPTDDGRIKPDIVAPGTDMLSTSNDFIKKYKIDSGTSMAAPVVSGTAGLLQQIYFSKHYKFLTAASLKGLIIHTAKAGEDMERPNYKVGWGALNAVAADHFIQNPENNHFLFERDMVNQKFDTIVCYSDGSPIKASLVWTDPPSDQIFTGKDALNNRKAHLVNDLDIRIFSDIEMSNSSSNGLMPYCLSVLKPAAEAYRGDNKADNVEKIYEDKPAAGVYYVVIRHKGTLFQNENQPYSLLLSGLKNAGENNFIEATRQEDDEKVKISWNPFGEGGDIYQVERRMGRFGAFSLIGTAQGNGNEFVDEGALTPNVEYYYRVWRMLPDNSIIMSKTVAVAGYLPIVKPANFFVTGSSYDANPREILLSWVDASNNERGFVVEKSIDGINFSPFDSLPATAGQGTVITRTYDNFPQNSINHFRIRAFGLGNNFSLSDVQFHSFKRASNHALTRVEYYFDSDPGFGNGIDLSSLNNATSLIISAQLDVSSLSDGFHTVFLRAMQNNNRWSNIISRGFYKFTAPSNRKSLEYVEYFFNEDPGLDKGYKLYYPAAAGTIDQSFVLPLDDLPVGLNTLFMRAKDNYGLWSNVFSRPFLKLNGPDGKRKIVEVLYSIDNGLLIQGGTPLSLTADSTLDLVIDLPPLKNGPHTVSIRAKDNVGFFSNIFIDSFFVNDESFCQLGSDVFFRATPSNALNYTWHEFRNNLWVPINDNDLFEGFNTRTLKLKKPPTNWYGKKFACVVDGRLDSTFTLKFNNTWIGQVSTDWHDYRNWSCGVVPDEFVDAVLPQNMTVLPEISEDGECRSLIIKNGAILKLKAGKTLLIYGNDKLE